jgi:hypothetical protein
VDWYQCPENLHRLMTILGAKPNYRDHKMYKNLAYLSLGTAPLKLDTLLEVLNKNLACNRMPILNSLLG